MKRFIILVGNYGSGKTELALHFAYEASQNGSVLMIDLDMINTYFRLYDHRDALEAAGIHLIAPNLVDAGIEMLTIPAEISMAFDRDWDTVVIDLGGDTGASALGQFHNKLKRAESDGAEILVFNVVNTSRPMADTPKKIIRLMEKMQQMARWPISGFILNSNLAGKTSVEHLLEGTAILKQVEQKTGVPILYVSGTKDVMDKYISCQDKERCSGKTIYLTTRMHRNWDTMTQNM